MAVTSGTTHGPLPEIDINTTQTATINAVLAGTQGLRIGYGDPSQGTLVLNGNNTFTGGIQLAGGTVRLGSSGALNSSTPNAIALTAPTANLILAGNSVAVAALSGGESMTNVIENDSPKPATLTVTGNSQNANYKGSLRAGQGGGALTLVMSGSGSQMIGGNNTISGGVIVNSGRAEPFRIGFDVLWRRDHQQWPIHNRRSKCILRRGKNQWRTLHSGSPGQPSIGFAERSCFWPR